MEQAGAGRSLSELNSKSVEQMPATVQARAELPIIPTWRWVIIDLSGQDLRTHRVGLANLNVW